MNPFVIVGPILGNVAAIFWFNLTGCGLVGPASPGSIIAYLMMAPGDKIVQIVIGVVIATVISFVVSSAIVRRAKGKSLEEAQEEMASRKAQAKGTAAPAAITSAEGVKKVVFACDAGMGSSAMGATKFRNRIKANRPDLTVINTSVDTIPQDCDIAVVQVTLVERARKCVPHAQIVTINNFLADPALDTLFEQLSAVGGQENNALQPAGDAAEKPSANSGKEILVKDGIDRKSVV